MSSGRLFRAVIIAFALCAVADAGVAFAHPAAAPIVLEGTIVTPDTVIRDGRVVVEKGRIAAVGHDVPVPAGSVVVRTNDLIYPGLIDLHNHVPWNVFPVWTPPQFYDNRYEWRAYPGYLNTDSRWNAALASLGCERNEYGELMALLGGTTTIQGLLYPFTHDGKLSPDANCVKGPLRSVDYFTGFNGTEVGHEKFYHILDVESITPESAAAIRRKLADKEITALVLHLAEGRPGDRESLSEFTLLESYGLLTDKTALIHGSGLDDAALLAMARKHAKLIWSPRSNLTLYDATVDIRAALRDKLLVALAPDWSITGSDNVLDELKVARIFFDDRNDDTWDRELVMMVTSNPAAIAGLGTEIGRIQTGYAADLVVVHGDAARPYGSLVDARVQDVDLVMIGGRPYYGAAPLMQALGEATDAEPMDVCGAAKLLHVHDAGSADQPPSMSEGKLVQRLTAAMAQISPEPRPSLAPLFSCR